MEASMSKKPAAKSPRGLDAIQEALVACTDGAGPLSRLEVRIGFARHYIQLNADAMDEQRAAEPAARAQHGLADLLTEMDADLTRLQNALTDVSNQVYVLQHPELPWTHPQSSYAQARAQGVRLVRSDHGGDDPSNNPGRPTASGGAR
jgi:hypothetical protein